MLKAVAVAKDQGYVLSIPQGTSQPPVTSLSRFCPLLASKGTAWACYIAIHAGKIKIYKSLKKK